MAQSLRIPNFKDMYEIVGDIRAGGCGRVMICVSKKDKKFYAVKELQAYATKLQYKVIKDEIDICRKLDHENVIKMIESFARMDVFHLVFEMMSGGDMLDDIESRTSYTEEDACHSIGQIFKGVAYVHGKNIIHRDLKPDNLLLSCNDKKAVVKIADFGSAIVAEGKISKLRFKGTPSYMPPEIFDEKPYDTAFDMWSCGVILYIALFGDVPFRGEEDCLEDEVCEGNLSFPGDGDCDSVSDQAKDLIRHLLNVDQNARYTANDALQHPFIRDRTKILTRFHRSITIENMKAFNVKKREWKSETYGIPDDMESAVPPRKSQSDGAIVNHSRTGDEAQSTIDKMALLPPPPEKESAPIDALNKPCERDASSSHTHSDDEGKAVDSGT